MGQMSLVINPTIHAARIDPMDHKEPRRKHEELVAAVKAGVDTADPGRNFT
jgi:hypothetical protein